MREANKNLAKNAIPARNRLKSGCGSAITIDPFG
jgi:hypothetical protein